MFLPLDRTLIIAEAGINHDGDFDAAKKQVDIAVEAGADYVKFQSFVAEELVLPVAERSSYIVEGSHEGESFRDLLKRLELSYEQQKELAEYCQSVGIKFLSTAFDLKSLDVLCDEIGCDIIKVASADLTNLRFLEHCASKNLPIVLSTGMADLPEIDEAMDTLQTAGAREIVILHCVSWYPSPPELINLRAMWTLRDRYGLPVGFSDHSLGTNLPVAAVAMGARCIEKHFTIDQTAFGPDHKASLAPDELIGMVAAIREVEAALGTGGKNPEDISEVEINQRRVHRRSIVTRTSVQKGD
ncbi:MAG TPA: hypothetical protein DCS82_08495, partial [Rhodospirillaceae bacterium]|nr:hypothetical protein [Rhodospirillaceae bacterium]